jgi:hypothetical protein
LSWLLVYLRVWTIRASRVATLVEAGLNLRRPFRGAPHSARERFQVGPWQYAERPREVGNVIPEMYREKNSGRMGGLPAIFAVSGHCRNTTTERSVRVGEPAQ